MTLDAALGSLLVPLRVNFMNAAMAVLACALLSAALCVQQGDLHHGGPVSVRKAESPPRVGAPIAGRNGIQRAIYRTLKAAPIETQGKAI